MEAFSLLKYWRGSGGGGIITGGGGGDGGANLRNPAATATTIVTAITHHAEEETDDDDDGPFFDLEFAVQDEAEEEEEKEDYTKNDEDENESQNDDVDSQDDSRTTDEEEGEEEREFNFTISSNSSGNDRTDPNLMLSPSDDLFFKGNLVPIEPSSLVFNSAEPNSKPQFPASLLKSATKFRVSMLGFKKSKQNVSEKTEQNNGSVTASAIVADNSTAPKQQQKQETEREKEKETEKQSKSFTVKFKVEEVPIMSLFARDNNSSRKSRKQIVEDSEVKKLSKDLMQKYLKKVKPLYIRVSKRYGEKLKFSGQSNLGSVTKPVPSTPLTAGQKPNPPKPIHEKSPQLEAEVGGETLVQVKSQKQVNNIPERIKDVCKQLGKSRSASSTVAAAPTGGVATSSRRDDSLLQQQDGIQSAILHCKRSFNAARDSDSSLLARSVSDPSHQKFDFSRKSSDQGKDGNFEP